MHLAESPVKMSLNGTAGPGTGPDLTGYPHLTYAPYQWGEGVRCASNGARVEEVGLDVADTPIFIVAERYGVSAHEALDAHLYAYAHGMI